MKVLLGIGAIFFVGVVLLAAIGGASTTGSSSRKAQRDPSGRFAAVNIPAASSGNYDGYCREQWTKRGELDHRMYDHCMGREREGNAELSSLVARHSSVPFLKDIVEDASQTWTKSGSRQGLDGRAHSEAGDRRLARP
jgi:hypothetical protein